jgi:2-polyprenyl-3-methyl-5-hydroxy-6-metoxy-1,4-benzoquinol methylase
VDMSTDAAWEAWGQRDPYFGVITNPKFRIGGIDEQIKQEFFESGESDVRRVLTAIQKFIDPGFAPRTVLDFGCGVGRVLIPFAKITEQVVGLDVSRSMLQEAQRNCEERQLRNVRLFESDDELTALTGAFDLIHSCIVFQHIPVERGRDIFFKLLQHLRPGGVGAIQLTYAKTHLASTYGIAPPTPLPTILPAEAPATIVAAGADPEIQMNSYNMSEILFLVQQHGIVRFHTEFTDHGGELGVFLFFQVPRE